MKDKQGFGMDSHPISLLLGDRHDPPAVCEIFDLVLWSTAREGSRRQTAGIPDVLLFVTSELKVIR